MSLHVSTKKENRHFQHGIAAPSTVPHDPLKTTLLLECGNPLENVLELHVVVRKPSSTVVGCCMNG
jgi:hypothetical protein